MMLDFKQCAIDAWSSHKHCFFPFRACKQFSKYNNLRPHFPCFFDHKLCNIHLSSMQIIQSKSIKIFSHHFYIICHMLPCWWISRVFSISDSYQVTPYWYSTPKIIKVFSCYQILICICTHHPTIIQCRYPCAFLEINMWKVWIYKRNVITVTPWLCL